MSETNELRTPPQFCQYVDDACDQDFSDLETQDTFFIYPGQPQQIAAAIDGAVQKLRTMGNASVSWKQLPVSGQLIFCEICKAMRSSRTIVADVSTLNFNLMFEIGFAIGLDRPLIPIRPNP